MDLVWQDSVASFIGSSAGDAVGEPNSWGADAGTLLFDPAENGQLSDHSLLWQGNNTGISAAGDLGTFPSVTWASGETAILTSDSGSLDGGLLWSAADPSGVPTTEAAVDATGVRAWLRDQFTADFSSAGLATWVADVSALSDPSIGFGASTLHMSSLLWSDPGSSGTGTAGSLAAPTAELSAGPLLPSFSPQQLLYSDSPGWAATTLSDYANSSVTPSNLLFGRT